MSEKLESGQYPARASSTLRPKTISRRHLVLSFCAIASIVTLIGNYNLSTHYWSGTQNQNGPLQNVPFNAQEILQKCAALKIEPRIAEDAFWDRDESDRFEPGTWATLIRNARVFTGRNNGTEEIFGDVLLDKGIVKAIGPGRIVGALTANLRNLTVVDADGAWITPGIVDLHSHLGLGSVPLSSGANDVNSPNGPIAPWLRSIDAFHTHDDAFKLAIAGGVTSAQILPGSDNAIGGQAFMVKLRKTKEGSPLSMVIEPPYNLVGRDQDQSTAPFRWRYMKQACGENLKGYGTRMDSAWALRSAYNEARKVKMMQDAFCEKAEKGLWGSLEGGYPDSYKWEMLVDVLRGRVKISNHCYETVDLDNIVRLTNEFEFPLASFHHASEAYLAPDLLKRTWGGTPAVALFATNSRYKREAFRASEFAPRILADHEIPVIMKSDHPVVNSRYLIHEARQAHYFGLPPHLALSSVTSTPAKTAGLSHRIGILREGSDADVVLWDSHPLQIGATPLKVWIDGIQQIQKEEETDGKPYEVTHISVPAGKDDPEWRMPPDSPNFDAERRRAIEFDGLPPLETRKENGRVVFENVKGVWSRDSSGSIHEKFQARTERELGTVVAEDGKIICAELRYGCSAFTRAAKEWIDLKGGAITPGLMSYGSPLGLEEIEQESSTGDGQLFDSFRANTPVVLGDVGGLVRAADALQFGTRNALSAYRAGVTFATVSFAKSGSFANGTVLGGLSVTFRTGAAHALEKGAIHQEVTALHVSMKRPSLGGGRQSSVAQDIMGLRKLLYLEQPKETESGFWFKKASEGIIPFVVEVNSADIMAALIRLKREVEDRRGTVMRMVFSGASEAHLLAREISEAKIGVILNPARPFPMTWEDRRILPGPPLTEETALVRLVENGVKVALGVQEACYARNVGFDLLWAALDADRRLGRVDAYALASMNLEQLLGVENMNDQKADLVAHQGGDAFTMSSKVVAVLSPFRGVVDLM